MKKNPALHAPHAPDAPKCVLLTTKLVLLSNYGIARNFIMYSDFFGPVIIRVLALQEGKTTITRDGTAGGKSQIVRTPLRVKHVSAGKPDWIFFYLKSPIDFTVF